MYLPWYYLIEVCVAPHVCDCTLCVCVCVCVCTRIHIIQPPHLFLFSTPSPSFCIIHFVWKSSVWPAGPNHLRRDFTHHQQCARKKNKTAGPCRASFFTSKTKVLRCISER